MEIAAADAVNAISPRCSHILFFLSLLHMTYYYAPPLPQYH